jgi:hypothetical protein
MWGRTRRRAALGRGPIRRMPTVATSLTHVRLSEMLRIVTSLNCPVEDLPFTQVSPQLDRLTLITSRAKTPIA